MPGNSMHAHETEKKERKPALQQLRTVWPELWALIKPRRGLLFVGLLLLLVNRVSGLGLPGAAKILVDEILHKHRHDLLIPLVVALVVLTLIQAASSFSLTQLLSKAAQRLIAELRQKIQDNLELGNVMEVPRLEKIVINMGVGKATQQASLLEGAVNDLGLITGQKPLVTKARRSIAAFKLRQGNSIGCMVTLRGDRMWEFFDRLISVVIPRIRDFRGLPPNSFDGRGNYTFGVNEQLIFPEIDYDKIDAPRGMDITIVTTARNNAEGKALLDAFGFPFRREGQN